MAVISVIVGSTREGRFSEKPAKWILQHLKRREVVDAPLLDLRDVPMPFFDQRTTPATPSRPSYYNKVVQRWTAAIAQSDGSVFVTPEYNYGTTVRVSNRGQASKVVRRWRADPDATCKIRMIVGQNDASQCSA